jgi:dihydrolipoamide dehydrogenase
MKAETQFDVVVIGSGPGGYVAALRSAQLGMQTALVEKCATFGGTCLNVGCIPSKALLDSSHLYARINDEASRHGITVGELNLDIAAMMARKERIVGTLTSGIATLMKAAKVITFQGVGSLRSSSEVEVVTDTESKLLTAKHIIIATGSVPTELANLPFDHELIVDSTDALAFEAVPEQLIVVGGGAVGLELASVWARLGAQVTVVELMNQLIPGCDNQVSRLLQRVLSKQGINILMESSVTGFEKIENRAKVTVESKDKGASELIVDKILVAVGRRPCVSGLGLENVGLNTDERTGRISVNETFMTSCDGIYAIGDVIGGAMLAHKAEAEGMAVAEIIAGKPGQVNYDAIAAVVYTEPEVAVVGKTQEQLQQANIEFNAGVFHFRANGRALAAESTDGFVKILADKNSDRVLGVHMIGPWVSDLIAEAVSVIEFGGCAEDIARTVHAHPTFSEVVQEAAMDVDKRSIHSAKH